MEFPDVDERRAMLAKLKGVEHRVYVQVADFDRVYAVADEDLDRTDDEKTSAVHFLRFELGPESISAFKSGSAISFGIDHDGLAGSVTLDAAQTESLSADLD